MNISFTGYLIIAVGTFLGTLILTPLARRLALSRNITDAPDGTRKLQRVPVPYLGGVALALSMTLAVAIGLLVKHASSKDIFLALSVMIPALLLAMVGLLDDRRSLPVFPRLMSQVIGGAGTAALSGLGGSYSHLTNWPVLDFILTTLWIVTLINAMNFMDNMDGLSGSIGAVAALGFFAISLLTHQYFIASLCIALAGSCLGFLRMNWAPARIYMGDAGALFIGFLLAVIAIRVNMTKVPHGISLLVPLCILALPLIDTTTVVVSRIRRGVSPLQGGRDHLSHRVFSLWERRRTQAISRQLTVLTVGTLIAVEVFMVLIAFSLASLSLK